jgi:Spy/CpxP family protein refolding chaperone
MKRLIRIAGLLAFAMGGTTMVSWAQDSGPAANSGAAGMNQGGSAEPSPADRIEKMKEDLGLSDDQVTQIQKLFSEQMGSIKPLRDQLKTDMETLQQKMDSMAKDPEVKEVLEKFKSDRKILEEAQAKLMDRLSAILTPTQEAKAILEMDKRGRGMMINRPNAQDSGAQGQENKNGN